MQNLKHKFLIVPWAASFVTHSAYLMFIFFFFFFVFQYLDCLWSQIQKLKKDRWQERHILRPYLAFDSILCEALQHNLPPFTPPPHTEDSVYPMPRVIFRMFDYTDDPEVRDSRGGADFTIRFRGQQQTYRQKYIGIGKNMYWFPQVLLYLPLLKVCYLLPSFLDAQFLSPMRPWPVFSPLYPGHFLAVFSLRHVFFWAACY